MKGTRRNETTPLDDYCACGAHHRPSTWRRRRARIINFASALYRLPHILLCIDFMRFLCAKALSSHFLFLRYLLEARRAYQRRAGGNGLLFPNRDGRTILVMRRRRCSADRMSSRSAFSHRTTLLALRALELGKLK